MPVNCRWLTFCLGFFILLVFSARGMAAVVATPTFTPTMTATMTPTPTVSLTFTVSATATEIVNSRVAINHNSFNPLSGQTVEILNLNSQMDKLTIRVYNQNGVFIREIMKDEAVIRGLVPKWDGRNSSQEVVASGVYLIVIDGGRVHKRFRVAVIK
jgi:flagellar hook assembly protein FlgD